MISTVAITNTGNGYLDDNLKKNTASINVNEGIQIESIKWYELSGSEWVETADTSFAEGKEYKVEIGFSVEDGYVLSTNPAFTCTIESRAAAVVGVNT